MSVVLTTTSETEAGLELLVTVATPDTQQDLVIEGTFETGIRKAMGKVVFSKLLHSNYFLGGKSLIVCVWSSPLVLQTFVLLQANNQQTSRSLQCFKS